MSEPVNVVGEDIAMWYPTQEDIPTLSEALQKVDDKFRDGAWNDTEVTHLQWRNEREDVISYYRCRNLLPVRTWIDENGKLQFTEVI